MSTVIPTQPGILLLAAMEGGKVRPCLAEPNIPREVCAAGRFSDCSSGRNADEVLRQHLVFRFHPRGMEPAR